MASKRQQILDAMVSKLQGTGVFALVTKSVISPDDVREFPVAMVLGGDAEYTPLTATQYTSGPTHDSPDGWNIHVFAYVNGVRDTDRVNVMENIIKTIMDAVFADITLGVTFVQATYLSAVMPSYDWERNIGIAEIVWSVKYDFEKSNT